MYGITINANSGQSQYKQLYTQLRDRIIGGFITTDAKLAGTRELASALGLSRSIVLEVIDQLKAEGYVETRIGSGTYVLAVPAYREGFSLPGPSRENTEKYSLLSFTAGRPDLALFPRRSWNKCYTSALEYATDKDLDYTIPWGRKDLREALREYLFRQKGIEAEADQIIITAGSSQALAITAMLKEKQGILLEDPLATFVYDIFKHHNCSIRTAKVDEWGILPDSISMEGVDLIYTSPSHQFPLGGTLPAKRRLELLKKASQNGAYIIEDDYDGEFRYEQKPIAPIQVLGSHRVIYIGTFSKILSPALRMGYMVVPPALKERFRELKLRWDLFNEGLNQMAMARFLNEGYMERHVRKMTKLYRDKKNAIVDMVQTRLGSEWTILGDTTGLHLVLQKKGALFNEAFEEKLKAAGVEFPTVASCCLESLDHVDKLVLGFGNRTLEEIKHGLITLRTISG